MRTSLRNRDAFFVAAFKARPESDESCAEAATSAAMEVAITKTFEKLKRTIMERES